MWKTLFIPLILILLISCNSKSNATNYPFPQPKRYPYGIKANIESQEEMNNKVQIAYENWLSDYLTTESCPKDSYRIHMGKAMEFATVSEGIGWGMLIMIFMDNEKNNTKKYFDGLYKFYKSYLDANGLMNWKINRYGDIVGENAATEADENVAMALLFAHKQWGSQGTINYLKEAKSLINKIMEHEVEKPNYIVKPGDVWGGAEVLNPCYFDPAYYRIWMSVTEDKNWQKVTVKSYEILNYFYKNYSTGLVPDWCKEDGSKADIPGCSYSYRYNACQVPLKMTLDYIWFGTKNSELAHNLPHRLSGWIKKRTKENPSQIKDGYNLDGTIIGEYNNAAFVGPFAVAAMVDTKHQDWLNKTYKHLSNMSTGGDWGYYPDTLRLVSLLVLTGNMPNFYDIES